WLLAGTLLAHHHHPDPVAGKLSEVGDPASALDPAAGNVAESVRFAATAFGGPGRCGDPAVFLPQSGGWRVRSLAVVGAVLAGAVFVAGVVEVAADRAARGGDGVRAAELRPDVLRYH